MNHPVRPVFPQPLLDAFARDPDRPAFEFGLRPVPRGEVLELVRRCAAALDAAGAGAGRDRTGVAVTTAVTPTGFAAQIAAHLLGCRVTGLRPGLTPRQLDDVLAQGVDLVLADDTTRTEALAGAAKAAGARILDVERDLAGGPPPAGGTPAAPLPAPRGRPGDIALITLTSGSTGRPKGCAQTYRSLSEHWSWQEREHWGDAARELAAAYRRFLVFGTLTSAVMLEHLALCLIGGGTAVIPDSPVSFPYTWRRHRVTACLCTVPRLYQVLDTLRAEDVDTSDMRALLVAGSPLPPHRLAEAAERLGPVVHQGYGQTETGLLTLLTPLDQQRYGERVRDTVGRPMPGVDIEVRDGAGRMVPAGAPGEIWVRTAGAMSGYWQDPEQTAEVLQDGWIRTRDLGTLDADGFLRLVGRTRDVIFVNAVLHYAGAIETALAAHPAVDQAYVVGAPDERTGEAAHAFVVPARPGRLPDPDELRALVRAELGDGAVPATVTVVDGVPVAPSGKPDKKALLARIRGGHGDAGAGPEPVA
ncbi:class I adenylate-forming enzyme family protein [Streptomyces sp. HPF1205]|uniref:class I adenylate-forming enzyme family protein n=1 Tax=Streptomyces sp. HPF1205 TaxID=2873262 RepID=UPI001CEDB99F|nr:fatty acid--CoA ligase family protein [Streptomyces sp. HPF1205]